jgi:hypothetical protein
MDYGGPEVEDNDVRETLRLKKKDLVNGAWQRPISNLVHAFGCGRKEPSDPEEQVSNDTTSEVKKEYPDHSVVAPRLSYQRTASQGKQVLFYRDDATTVAATDIVSPINSPEVRPSSPAPTVIQVDTLQQLPSPQGVILHNTLPQRSRTQHYRHRIINTTLSFFQSLMTPPSISILVSFIISLVPTLKALFVPGVPGIHIHPAPDGLPPLSFVIDATSFIGAASVPMGLICLGSALARLKVPRGQWGQLPLGAIGALAVGKMLIIPVLGLLICEGLTNVGVIDKNDKVLRFVCMSVSKLIKLRHADLVFRFFSCLPTATTQVHDIFSF